MMPDMASIIRKRYRVRRRLLYWSIGFFLVATMPMANLLFEVVFRLIGGEWPDWYGVETTFRWVTVLCTPGVLLLLSRSLLTRWLVPLPVPRCPRCGYEVVRLESNQCPECGLRLPEALVERGEDDCQ